MEKPAKSSTNPFGSEDEEDEEEEEDERKVRDKQNKGGDNSVSKDVHLESTPQAEQTRHHWLAVEKIISMPSQLTDPFLLGELGDHLTALQKLVAKERPELMGRTGDCLEVVLSQNIVESVYVFGTRQRVHGRGIRIMLLRFLTELLARCSQPLLIHQQILRPLNRLLRACETIEDGGVTSALVPLLHQICILLQENQSLLDLFFVESKAHHPSRFLPMTRLIPHMHDVTEIGNRSRDALLLCLSLADQLPQTNLSRFIATDCNFCQVLATGLSALYSDLPTTCSYTVDDWQSPLPVIEASVPELKRFYQALDFCNSVLQVSPMVICDSILSLVREGFLAQVLGPALFQPTEEAASLAMAYLTVFLSHISNVSLMREFLRFLVRGRVDGQPLLPRILCSVTSSSERVCSMALELLYALVDLNCEDVMLELVFNHLLTGHHLMPNQIPILAQPDIYGQAAKKLLQLLPSSCITAEKMFLDSIRPPAPPTQSPSHSTDTQSRASSPPPPPLLTSSPCHSSLLEKPKATHLTVPFKADDVSPSSTNPFDLPAAPRTRSGSNGSSCSSQTSFSSSISGGQHPNHARPPAMLSTTSAVGKLEFEYIPPAVAYTHNLLAAREAISSCTVRCRGWSNRYDQCSETTRTERAGSDVDTVKAKSLEMEDVTVKVDTVEPIKDGKSLERLSSFRSRAATMSTAYRLPLARSRDTGDATRGNATAPGGGKMRPHTQGTAGPDKAVHSPAASPRSTRKLDGRFEDKAGLLLKVLLDKLTDMLHLPPAVNIQLTRILSRLAHYPQPLLRSVLLNHQLVLRIGVPNLFTVLQSIKVTIDRHSRSQEGFERRLARARKTMIYRAHVRNAQIEESVASQIVSRLTKQTSVLSQVDSAEVATAVKPGWPVPPVVDSQEESVPSAMVPADPLRKARPIHRGGSRRTKPKKVSTDTLFAIVIFDEFLKELASLAHEHSCLNPSTCHPQPPP